MSCIAILYAAESAGSPDFLFARKFFAVKVCPEFVQRGLSPTLMRDFDLRELLFHTVFNRTVENFHTAFIFIRLPEESVARKLLRRGSRAAHRLSLPA
jgi:hypothetical protein